MIKTLSEHCEFVKKTAGLCFFFAWNIQKRVPEETLPQFIMQHTPLYFDILGLPADHLDPHFHYVFADTAEAFENGMLAANADFLDERAKITYPESFGVYQPPEFRFGSLRYDSPHPQLPPDWCIFHIRNARFPVSPFADPKVFACDFMELLDAAEKEFGYTKLYTRTWLNDVPAFLQFFPQEWQDNRYERNENGIPSWDLGSWGQIINARGTFNESTGEFIRKNLRLKYIPSASHCSFQGMRRHLQKITMEKKN